jgi:hypothetical protein
MHTTIKARETTTYYTKNHITETDNNNKQQHSSIQTRPQSTETQKYKNKKTPGPKQPRHLSGDHKTVPIQGIRKTRENRNNKRMQKKKTNHEQWQRVQCQIKHEQCNGETKRKQEDHTMKESARQRT